VLAYLGKLKQQNGKKITAHATKKIPKQKRVGGDVKAERGLT
jgi:hypothetical protein